MNDISSEIGRQSVVLVDMNYELASKKKFGFGLRANIGLRIQENLFAEDWSARLKPLSELESDLINTPDSLFRFHSGI